MVYEHLQWLPAAAFKRFCGVRPATFATMVDTLRDRQQQTHRKSGRPPKLRVEDHMLLTLGYWREYRTLFHLAASWGVHESTARCIVHHIEDALMQSGAFRLPGKKALPSVGNTIEVIVVDATETPIERPKKAAAKLKRSEEAPYAESATRGQRAHRRNSVHRARARSGA